MAQMGRTIDVPLRIDVTGLPQVTQLAHAARDVVDHAVPRDEDDQLVVSRFDLERLRAAVSVYLPGADV